MAESNKVIMHLEVTDGIQNENSSEYFISGPVKIFAAVDDLSTTFEEDGICGLFSDRFLEVVKNSSLYDNKEPIIVFVRNLFDSSNPDNIPASDSLKYRGSYFLFEYDTESWQEVLIGTHTHENKEILDKFSELDISGAENKLLSIIPDKNGYSFAFVEDNRLPTLPGSVLKAIEDNNNLPNFPNSNEGHHLDGTVVYNSEDPTVIATCNDLYDYLRTKGKHLHITKIADEILLSKESGQILESFQHIIAEEDLHPVSVLEFTGTLSFDGFEFLVFVGNNALNPLTYDIKSSGNKIFVKIPRDDAALNDVVTVLALEPGEITVKNLYNVVLEEDITLSQIRDFAFQVYIDIALNKRKEVPKVYLTNDDKGNIVWENELLPAQTFYSQSVLLYNNEVQYDASGENVVAVFKDVNFNFSHDFPIILANQLFAFDAKYFVSGENNENLTVTIPASLYFDFNDDAPDRITLLVIKNTAGGAFTNEILKNYVSKEDAIDILSHGKISLSDYATISELQSYARKAHNHSNYALRGHNHDYRYADYAHTHAEYVTKAYLLQLVSTYLNKESPLSDNDIVDLSENLVIQINELLAQRGFVKLTDIENVFSEAGFLKDDQGYYLGSDRMFINTESISDNLLKKLLYDGEAISNIETLNLTELTERILDLFNRDSIQDTNVFVDKDIPVYADVGGIKQFDRNGYRRIIREGTQLHDILNEMLNPYISKQDIEDMLTPVIATFSYYSDEKCMHEIDFDNLTFDNDNRNIYFKFKKFLNKFGEACEYVYRVANGDTISIRTKLDTAVLPVAKIDYIGDVSDPVTIPVSLVDDTTDLYKITVPQNKNFVLELFVKTLIVENIPDNRLQIVIDRLDPVTIGSDDIFCIFKKCLLAYAISENPNPTVFENTSYGESLSARIMASTTKEYLVVAYDKSIENTFDIVSGTMSVRDAFVVLENYNISSELNEINDDEYVFLRYEILPHNDSFKVILLADSTKICDTPSNVESDTVISDEIIVKVDALYDAISNGAVKISDLTIIDHAKYSGTFYLNKDISPSNIVVTLFKDNDDLTSDFNIVAQPAIFLNRNFWKYDFTYSGTASYPGADSLAVYVDDGITTDTAHAKIISPIVALRHYVLNIDGAGLDLNSQNTVVNNANEPLNVYSISGNADGDNAYLVYLVKKSFIPNSTLDRIRFEVNGMAGGFRHLDTSDTLYTTYFENLPNISDYTVFISNNPNLGSIILHIFAI